MSAEAKWKPGITKKDRRNVVKDGYLVFHTASSRFFIVKKATLQYLEVLLDRKVEKFPRGEMVFSTEYELTEKKTLTFTSSHEEIVTFLEENALTPPAGFVLLPKAISKKADKKAAKKAAKKIESCSSKEMEFSTKAHSIETPIGGISLEQNTQQFQGIMLKLSAIKFDDTKGIVEMVVCCTDNSILELIDELIVVLRKPIQIDTFEPCYKILETMIHFYLQLIKYIRDEKAKNVSGQRNPKTAKSIQEEIKRLENFLEKKQTDQAIESLVHFREMHKVFQHSDLIKEKLSLIQETLEKYFTSRWVQYPDDFKSLSKKYYSSSYFNYQHFLYIIKVPILINETFGEDHELFHVIQVGYTGIGDIEYDPSYMRLKNLIAIGKRLYDHWMGWKNLGDFSVPTSASDKKATSTKIDPNLFAFQNLKKYSNLVGLIGVHPKPGMKRKEVEFFSKSAEIKARLKIGTEFPLKIARKIDYFCFYNKMTGKKEQATNDDWFSYSELRIVSDTELNEIRTHFHRSWDSSKCVDEEDFLLFLKNRSTETTIEDMEVNFSFQKKKETWYYKGEASFKFSQKKDED